MLSLLADISESVRNLSLNESLNNNNDATGKVQANIGGIPYILNYLWVYTPYILFSTIGVIVGVVGNTLIFGSILTSKELRNNPTCILILNLAAADFSISFIVDSFSIVGEFITYYNNTNRFFK